MISLPLLKRNLICCVKPFCIIFALLLMYTTVIIYMFDPALAQMLNDYQQALPEVMAAVGMTGTAANLLEWIQIYLYGFIMLLLPLVFIVVAVYSLVMRYVDRGSIAALLSTPNSRTKIIVTQLLSDYLWLVILMAAVTLTGIVSSEAMFPGELELSRYLLLNLGTLLLWFAVAAIAFAAACFFSESKYYYAVGGGLPVLFFLFQMMGNMGERLDFLKYLTLYSLLSAKEIVTGELGTEVVLPCLALLGITVLLSVFGCLYFKRRDLSV